jgi:hypothetical protein
LVGLPARAVMAVVVVVVIVHHLVGVLQEAAAASVAVHAQPVPLATAVQVEQEEVHLVEAVPLGMALLVLLVPPVVTEVDWVLVAPVQHDTAQVHRHLGPWEDQVPHGTGQVVPVLLVTAPPLHHRDVSVALGPQWVAGLQVAPSATHDTAEARTAERVPVRDESLQHPL